MTDPDKSMTITTQQDGDRVVVTLAGELDMHSSGDLGAAMAAALDLSPRTVEIDARGLSFTDSAGLRALLLARGDAAEHGVDLKLAHVSDPLDRLLEMTGLRETLGVTSA
jgi:anti-sigma B factor antagonist